MLIMKPPHMRVARVATSAKTTLLDGDERDQHEPHARLQTNARAKKSLYFFARFATENTEKKKLNRSKRFAKHTESVAQRGRAPDSIANRGQPTRVAHDARA